MVFKGCINNTQDSTIKKRGRKDRREREKVKHEGKNASMLKTLNIFLLINFISLWSTLNATYV